MTDPRIEAAAKAIQSRLSYMSPWDDASEVTREARRDEAREALAAADAVQPRTAPPDRERLVQVTMKHLIDARAYINLRHNAESLADAILAEWGEPS